DALRSRILFPDRVLQTINERAGGFTFDVKPTRLLETFLGLEIARGSVQSELCHDLLVFNRALAAERAAGPRWAVDRSAHAIKIGEKLSVAPCRVKGTLERTKYGALYLIEKLTDLGEVVEKNQCLDEQQVSFL